MKKVKYFFIVIFFISIFYSISFLYNMFVSNKLLDYSKYKLNNIIDIIVNNSINEELLNKVNIDELFLVNDNIINIDNSISNYMTNLINENIFYKLNLIINKKYSLLNIDSNYFTCNTSILFNTNSIDNGIALPINISIIGNPYSRIDLIVKEYGINNSVVSLNVKIKIMLKVKLIFSSDYYNIEKNVIIGNKIIEGEIPSIIRE